MSESKGTRDGSSEHDFRVGDVVKDSGNLHGQFTITGFRKGRDTGLLIAIYDDMRWGYISDLELVRRDSPPAPNVLLDANAVAGKDRAEAYGHPYDNHQRIANLWNAFLDGRRTKGPLSPADVALMMVLLKVARHQHAPKRDNLVDVCGYARCVELIEEREAEICQSSKRDHASNVSSVS